MQSNCLRYSQMSEDQAAKEYENRKNQLLLGLKKICHEKSNSCKKRKDQDQTEEFIIFTNKQKQKKPKPASQPTTNRFESTNKKIDFPNKKTQMKQKENASINLTTKQPQVQERTKKQNLMDEIKQLDQEINCMIQQQKTEDSEQQTKRYVQRHSIQQIISSPYKKKLYQNKSVLNSAKPIYLKKKLSIPAKIYNKSDSLKSLKPFTQSTDQSQLFQQTFCYSKDTTPIVRQQEEKKDIHDQISQAVKIYDDLKNLIQSKKVLKENFNKQKSQLKKINTLDCFLQKEQIQKENKDQADKKQFFESMMEDKLILDLLKKDKVQRNLQQRFSEVINK